MAIDPKKCIDCGLCVHECPVKAIYEDELLPDKWHEYVELNKRYAAQWPVVSKSGNPLPEADHFKNVDKKRHLLLE